MTATLIPHPFPAELQSRRAELLRASRHSADPAMWPEGERLLRAKGPEAIAEVLVRTFHPALVRRAIAYLWVESMTSGSQTKLGTAAKASAKVQLLAKVDFILTFNHTAYLELSFEQRVALIDHELQHCDVDGDTNQPMLVPHDVEEFGSIVRRYGLWKPDLRTFGRAVKDAMQGDLFNAPTADAPSVPAAAVRAAAVDAAAGEATLGASRTQEGDVAVALADAADASEQELWDAGPPAVHKDRVIPIRASSRGAARPEGR